MKVYNFLFFSLVFITESKLRIEILNEATFMNHLLMKISWCFLIVNYFKEFTIYLEFKNSYNY